MRTGDKASQLLSERLQPLSLRKNKQTRRQKKKTGDKVYSWDKIWDYPVFLIAGLAGILTDIILNSDFYSITKNSKVAFCGRSQFI